MSAIIVEQKAEEAKLAIAVHRNSYIDGMRLASAKMTRKSPKYKLRSAALTPHFRFSGKPIESGSGLLQIRIDFRFQGTVEVMDKLVRIEPVVEILCAYEVDYRLHEGFELSSGQARAFASGNAVFNAWPYFREFLQTSLQRMGFPALVAPFLRIQVRPKPMGRRKIAS